jgi:hypothetical protein
VDSSKLQLQLLCLCVGFESFTSCWLAACQEEAGAGWCVQQE